MQDPQHLHVIIMDFVDARKGIEIIGRVRRLPRSRLPGILYAIATRTRLSGKLMHSLIRDA